MPTSTSESVIRFFRSGGHKHDGISSSLIDYTKYSIFDFGTDVSTSGQDAARELTRENNQNRFNQYIANFISTQILAPAGIVLLENSVRGVHIGANEITANNIAANTITANEIAANTITASELAINVVQVGDTISSNNYVLGTTGWQIRSNGSAEFNNNIIVRGQIEATSGNFTGNINAGGTFANGSVSNGAITGGSLTIGTANNIFKVASNGSMWLGDASITLAPFSVTNAGVLYANSGTIGGWTLAGSYLTGGNTTLYSNGYISATGASFVDSGWRNGGSNVATSQFGVDIDGTVRAIKGALAGFGLSTGDITQGNVTLGTAVTVTDGTTYSTQITGGRIDFKKTNVVRGSIYGDTTAFGNTIFYSSAGAYFNGNIFLVGTGTTTFLTTLASSGSAGTVVHNSGGLLYRYTSRREFKKDIIPVVNGISKVKQLNPVTYKLRYNHNEPELKKYLLENHTQYGFIVEDILDIDRGLVVFDYYNLDPNNRDFDFSDESNFTPTMYDSNGIISILTASVKELVAKVESLESKLGV